jgi:hypothetical protein
MPATPPGGLIDHVRPVADACHDHTAGSGHLCQGRFKAFPIEADDHLLTVLRYVERNPLRPGWSARRTRGGGPACTRAGPPTRAGRSGCTPGPSPCRPSGSRGSTPTDPGGIARRAAGDGGAARARRRRGSGRRRPGQGSRRAGDRAAGPASVSPPTRPTLNDSSRVPFPSPSRFLLVTYTSAAAHSTKRDPRARQRRRHDQLAFTGSQRQTTHRLFLVRNSPCRPRARRAPCISDCSWSR